MKKAKRVLKDIYFIVTNEFIIAIVSIIIAVVAIVTCVNMLHH